LHVHEDTEPEPRPKWDKTTLQDVGDIVGDIDDARRTQYDFEVPPLALTTTKLMPPRHDLLVQYSNAQSYGEVVGNPFWESTM
jgi:hypothetical protein